MPTTSPCPWTRPWHSDAAGNEYPNLADAKPVGKGTGQRRQFGFAVPTGTELVTLRLSNGFTLDLSGT